MDQWTKIEEIDGSLCEILRAHFVTLRNLDCAIETFDDCLTIVDVALSGSHPTLESRKLARDLMEWKIREAPRLKRTRREQVEECWRTLPLMKQQRCSSQDCYEHLVMSSPALGLAALEKSLKKKESKRRAGLRQDKEDKERERWALQLACYIEEANLPVCKSVRSLKNSNNAWVKAFGSRRANTLKLRAKTWAKVSAWMAATYGRCWPKSTGELLQYLDERHEIQPMGKTVPCSIHGAVLLLENVGQVPLGNRISEDPLWLESVKAWTADLEKDAPPKKIAPHLPIAVLLAAELLVGANVKPIGLRFTAFAFLLMAWATLRADDLQHVDPSSLMLSQLGLRLTLKRTKTTGPGKSIGDMTAFIARGASISGVDWLRIGWELLEGPTVGFGRDFFMIDFADDWTTPYTHYLEPEGVGIMIRKMLKELPCPARLGCNNWIGQNDQKLLQHELASFWTGHSARHTLPTLAAAIGSGKDQRDYLGRWAYQKHGSNDYVVTARQIVHSIQMKVVHAIIAGEPAPGIVEEELFDMLRAFALERKLNSQPIIKKLKILSWNERRQAWQLGGKFPTLRLTAEELGEICREPVEIPEPLPESEQLPEAPFFVTVSRNGSFRRLHLSKSCAVKQERCLFTVPVFELKEDVADAICKICRPGLTEQALVESSEAESPSSEEGDSASS